MTTTDRTLTFVRRALFSTVALSALVGASLSAQQPVAADTVPASKLDLRLPASYASEAMFSSSSAESNEVAVAEHGFNFVDAGNTQPGQRRYGRPRYRGSNTNADGSNKYDFFAGGGFTGLVGAQSAKYLKNSWALQVGGGRQFNKNLALNLQFDYDNFGFTGQTISDQAYVYFGDATGNTQYGLDGSSHIWSFTLNPTYNIYQREGLGAYVVVGGGFYHKTANFFVPEVAQGCGYGYYGYECYNYIANATIQNYTSNSVGVNGGFGLTYKISRFSSEQFYGEVRLVHTFNQYKPGVTAASSTTTLNNYNGYNYFPQNSQDTTYLPVKFGIRF